MELRLESFQDCIAEVTLTKLPVVFQGTPAQCRNFAEKAGYTWKDSRRMLFGGYWYKAPTKDQESSCLHPS